MGDLHGKSGCGYQVLEECLERNGRDLSRCEKELAKFKAACECRRAEQQAAIQYMAASHKHELSNKENLQTDSSSNQAQ